MVKYWSPYKRILVALALTPVEVINRVLGLHCHVEHGATFFHPTGWTLTARAGMPYDSFTYAPNLRKIDGSKSNAAAIHDQGWDTGRKDDGTWLSFDQCNEAFDGVLEEEGHPEWVRKLYVGAVSLPHMRKRWRRKHGHE